MRAPRTSRIALALVLGTALTTGCGDDGTRVAGPPPTPDVVDVPDPIPPPPADGLHRFVVRPPASPIDGGSSGDGDGGGASPTVPTDPAWTLDAGLVGRLDDDTVVEFRDGVPGFVDDGGRFIALVGSYHPGAAFRAALAERSEGDGDGDTFVETLLDVEGVVSVVAIGDGSYAVATADPETLVGLGLDTTIDAPLALAADDPYEPYQWTLDNTGHNLDTVSSPPAQTPDADIDGKEAAAGARGRGVVVAVIDTGVDFSHPDLAGQSWVNDDETCGNDQDDDGNGFVDDCRGWDFGNEDPDSYSPGQNDHGTHVAGIIGAVAGNGQGVAGLAPEVEIMGLNVEGPGGMSTSSVARAVRYAVDNGADVINLSLGTQPGTPAAYVQPLIDAVGHADRHGVLVVAAAGNSSVDIGSSAVYPASIDGPNMIVAGAAAPDETRASFSNYGQPVDLFAPGVLILSTVPGGRYTFMSGTSQASPTVAAVAANVLAADPGLDPSGVRAQLLGTGDEFGAYANLAENPIRLNAARALGLAGDPTGVEVTIGGLAGASTGGVSADISLHVPDGAFEQPFHWEASLVAIDGSGQAHGIVDHPISIDWQPDATDGRGAVALAASGADRAHLDTSLPPGHYALVVEAVPDDDGSVRLGDAFISTFEVPDDTPPPSDGGGATTTTTAPGGSGGATTTTSSGSGGATTTTSSGSGGATTTTPPVGANPTTTAPGTTTTSGGPTTTTTTTSTTAVAPSTSTVAAPSTTTRPATTTTRRATTTTWPATTTRPATTTTRRATTTTRQATTVGPTTATTGPPATVTAPPPTTAAPTTTTTGAPSGGTTRTTTSNGGFAVTTVSPASGATGAWTMVSIHGTFPSQVYVWFGDRPGDLVFHSSSWILVMAPPRSEAGAVDITFRSSSAGTVLLVEDGYTYVGLGAPGGDVGTTTTTGGGPTPTTARSGTTTTTVWPGSTSTTPPAPTTSTTAPSTTTSTTSASGGSPSTTSGSGTTTTTSGQAPTTQAARTTTTTSSGSGAGSDVAPRTVSRPLVLGDPVDLGGGLRGVRLQGLGDLDGVPLCSSDPCRTRRV